MMRFQRAAIAALCDLPPYALPDVPAHPAAHDVCVYVDDSLVALAGAVRSIASAAAGSLLSNVPVSAEDFAKTV